VSFLLNQYSFIVVAILLAAATGFILLRHKPDLKDYLAFTLVIAGLFAAWMVIHPHQTPLMNDAKAVQDMIGAGKPVLLEFQSPY